MRLAVIQPIEMTMHRIWVPLVRCDRCRQQMPADHRTHNSGAGPVAPEPAPDPNEGNHRV